MPIIKSAKKRVRVANRAAVRNAKTKRSVKSAVKAFQTLLDGGTAAKLNDAYAEAQSAIDTAAKKNVIHKNKAARKKAQLAKQMKAAGAKPAAKKAAPAKKPAAKKAPVKAAAKKPATKTAKK